MITSPRVSQAWCASNWARSPARTGLPHTSIGRRPDVPADLAVVVVNPDDEVTPESFAAWLDRRQVGEPVDPGVKAAETLAEARAAGEV